MRVVGYVLGAIAAVAIIIYGSFALYTGSWALSESIANHQAHVIHHGYEYQSTLARQINKDIAGVLTDKTQLDNLAADPGSQVYIDQRARLASDAGDVCQEADQVTSVEEVGPNAFKFIQANCEFGALKPTSIYAIAQN